MKLFPEQEDPSELQEGTQIETIVGNLVELSKESLEYIQLYIELELEERKEGK